MWLNLDMAWINLAFISYIIYVMPELDHPTAVGFFMFHALGIWLNALFAERYRQRAMYYLRYLPSLQDFEATLTRIRKHDCDMPDRVRELESSSSRK
jgi:hypothetical protein